MPNEDIETLSRVLGYWYTLDFLEQDDLPKAKRWDRPARLGRGGVIDQFEPKGTLAYQAKQPGEAGRDDGGPVPAQGADHAEEPWAISCVEGRLKDIGLSEAQAKKANKEVFIHLGRIEREALIACLLKTGPDERDKRVEKETGFMAAAILGLAPNGAFASFELSPLLWLAGEGDLSKLYIAKYQECNDKIVERLAKQYTNPLSEEDVRQIVRSEIIKPFLRPILGADEAIERGAHALLFDCQAHAGDAEPYKVSFAGYFTEDIKALNACLHKAGGLDELDEGPLALVAQYLETGLDGELAEERAARRRCALPIDASDEEACASSLEFYRDKMGYGSMPLGRWPSKYTLSFMQQAGVNLVAGRGAGSNGEAGTAHADRAERGETSAHYDAPQRIWSVNGPPGTGKTTLLKDVVAANVVEKARLLCAYDTPDDAFEKVALPERPKGYLQYCDGVYRLKDERIAGLGIVVCSSNNAAVENISMELPKAEGLFGGVGDEERAAILDEDDDLAWVTWCPSGKSKGESRPARDLYFSFPAYNQFREWVELDAYPDHAQDDSNPSGEDETANNLDLLLAARLGKKKNVNAFLGGPLDKLFWNWPDREEALSRFRKAKKEFLAQYEKVQAGLSDLAACEDLERRLAQAQAAYQQAQTKLEAMRGDCLDAHDEDLSRVKEIAHNCRAPFEGTTLEAVEELHDELSKRAGVYRVERKACKRALNNAKAELEEAEGAFFIIRDKKVREAQQRFDKAEHDLDLFEVEHEREARCEQAAQDVQQILDEWAEREDALDSARAKVKRCGKAIDTLEVDLADRCEKAESRRAYLVEGSDPEFSRIDEGFVRKLASENDDDRKKAHLFNPISNAAFQRERDLLFIKALRVTREFVFASKYMKFNLRYLRAYWGARSKSAESGSEEVVRFKDRDAKAMAPALFQALNLITPVISTTFASAQRLFGDIPITGEGTCAHLGLLVIDEAGQALPYAALGVLARSRRAMVVGDPFQVEPVVSPGAKLLREKLAGDIAPLYKQDSASVQRLADEANPYGRERADGEGGSTWVGCPLVVHRRCISPMFEISNEVAYQGTMLNETARLDPNKPKDKERLDRFYKQSAQWFNVACNEVGKKNHYVDAQGKRVVEIVTHAFEKSHMFETPDAPSLFIISPFKTVVAGIRGALRDDETLRAMRKNGGNDVDKKFESFLKDNIGTVHTFQGKEADEVVFVLGCDKNASGAVNFVGLNIVNVAASRAKHRLYVVGDYNVWKSNPYIAQMKRILDTAWLKHWKAYQETNDPEELRIAHEMQPLPESMPFVDEDELDAAEDELLDLEDDDTPIRDASSLLQNMACLLGDQPLLESLLKEYYTFYGFSSAEELEEALFSTMAVSSASRKFIMDGLILTRVHYEFSSNLAKIAVNDFSSCLIYLVKATERYLRACVFPLLSAICAEPSKGSRKKLPLGDYSKEIKSKKDELARITTLGFACDGGAAMQEEEAEQRWLGLSGAINKFAPKRNIVCHSDKEKKGEEKEAVIDSEFASKMLDLAARRATDEEGLGGAQSSGDVAASEATFHASLIMCEGTVLAAAQRGLALGLEPSSSPEEPEVPQAAEAANARDVEPGEVTEQVDALSGEHAGLEAALGTKLDEPGDAGFSLRDAESPSEGEECLSYTKLKANKFRDLGYTPRQALDVLRADGYIEDGIFEEAKGPLPTKRGCAVGIKWRRYKNSDGTVGAGIVFTEAGQDWLANYLRERAESHGWAMNGK